MTATAITPDSAAGQELEGALASSGVFRLARSLANYPSEFETKQMLRAATPSVVFLGLDDLAAALVIAETIDRESPRTQIIAMDRTGSPQVLMKAMRAGIREVLDLPLESAKFRDSLSRVMEVLERHPVADGTTDRLFCFLPAKPGGGASTLAALASLAVSKLSDRKALLMDLDLNNGISSFLLKAPTNSNSIHDAVQHAPSMDESLWAGLVTARGNLDLLASGRSDPSNHITTDALRELVNYAQHCYGTICFDLSGNMEPFSLDLLHECKQVFLVCTQDVAGLHLARAKAETLKRMDLSHRASILVNRTDKSSLFTTQEIEKLVGLRVRFNFPSDERRVASFITDGSAVPADCDLGRQIHTLAGYMLDLQNESAPHAAPPRRFADFFSKSPRTSPAGTPASD